VWYAIESLDREHGWVEVLAASEGATIPVPGFGAGDCQADCQAHLIQIPSEPGLDAHRPR